MSVTPPNPPDIHAESTYWGKAIPTLIDLELLQAYENCLNAEAAREYAKEKLLERKLTLPPPNPEYEILKTAIVNEINKRNLKT